MGKKDNVNIKNSEKVDNLDDGHVIFVDRKYIYDNIGKDEVFDTINNVKCTKMSKPLEKNVKNENK